jgi:hypothetical protein
MNVLCIQVNNKDIASSDLTAKAYLFAAVKNDGLTYQPLPQWFKAPESEWKSDLPVFVINTKNQVIADEPKIMAHLGIVQHNNGMPNNPFDEFNSYNGLIGIELRGSSSQIFPKRSYGIETWSTFKTSVSISVLDLPPENDWVLYGPYTDKTLIRNALAYSLFNGFQHYSPRTRFIELFIDGEYKGLYLLTEKIKRSTNRVNITKLSEKDLYDMEVTGGYLLKLDKKTGNSSSKGFYSNFLPSAGSQYPYFIYTSPSGDEILPEQEEYIQQQLNVFETALNSENYADPQKGYRPFIHINSFVDYFILNELSKNIDGYRLSTYIYKDRDDIDTRFYAGPVWDYDLAFGNASYANASCTSGWQYTIDGEENPIPFWWVRFMSDEYFTGCLKCRWEELRKGILNTDSINHTIDQLVQQIGQAAERNFETYQILGSYIWPNAYNGNTYEEEIDHLKSWILDRSVFLDENMPGNCAATNTEYHRQNDFSVNVYPNPSKDALHIEIDNPASVQLTLQVVNATGQTVFTLRPAKDNLINLSVNLPGGIYQVVVNDNQSHIALKAIVL